MNAKALSAIHQATQASYNAACDRIRALIEREIHALSQFGLTAATANEDISQADDKFMRIRGLVAALEELTERPCSTFIDASREAWAAAYRNAGRRDRIGGAA